MDFEQVISQLADDVRAIRAEDAATKTAPHEARRGSRYVGQGADPSFAQEIAAGGELRLAERQSTRLSHKVPGGGLAGVFTKALSEGTGSSGGFLVPVEVSAEVVRLMPFGKLSAGLPSGSGRRLRRSTRWSRGASSLSNSLECRPGWWRTTTMKSRASGIRGVPRSPPSASKRRTCSIRFAFYRRGQAASRTRCCVAASGSRCRRRTSPLRNGRRSPGRSPRVFT